MVRFCTVLLTLIGVLAGGTSAFAQTQSGRGRLSVTVTDPTGGALPTAAVTLVGAEANNRTIKLAPVLTATSGIAIFENLAPGRYLLSAQFTGFETLKPREVRVRTGENRETVVLELARVEDAVTVGRDQQEAGSDRASTFGTMLSGAQIAELSDDPDIMRQQLEDLAGPGMTIVVDSFEGGQLPNKSQIRSIRISRDQFAAESHYAGGIRIDIVTQPGQSELRGNVRSSFYTSAMDGRNPLVNAAPPTQNRNGGIGLTGSIIKNVMSFSVSFNGQNNFATPVQAASASGGTGARVLDLKTRNTNMNMSGSIDWAVTKDQTVRLGVQRYRTSSANSGIGTYDGPERSYTGESRGTYLFGAHTGPVGRRTMWYNRFYFDGFDQTSESALEALTYIVPEDLNRGGAQRRGGTYTRVFTLNSDVDHVRGRHSFRTGIELQRHGYRSDAETNYLGTYHFEGPEEFAAGRPRSFTKRIGDPNISYANYQVALYFQDDIRISRTLTMTPGVRYEVQSLVNDHNNVMPRFGVTWAPGQGKTTYRASAGIFYDWLSTGIYQQTLQFDGFRMQEVNLANPAFPDPGELGSAPPTQRYLLADDVVLPRTGRVSLGVSRTVNTRLSVSGVYAYTRAIGQLVGENLNAPVNGVRPDPQFANVIRAIAAGRARAHSLDTSINLNLAGLGANPTTGPLFQWRRGLRLSGSYAYGTNYNNTEGAFSVPATDLESEWGPSNGDIRHRASLNFGTAMIRGLSASMGVNKSSARPLTIRTGTDDNGDLIFNDRPVGLGRNSARVPGQWNSNANFGYTFSFGSRQVNSGGGVSITSGAGGAPTVNMIASQAQARYRLTLSVNIQNLFNRPVYGGYSGVMTSRNFLQPTSATSVRRTTVNLGLTF